MNSPIKAGAKLPGPLNMHVFRKMKQAERNFFRYWHSRRGGKHRRRMNRWARQMNKWIDRVISLP